MSKYFKKLCILGSHIIIYKVIINITIQNANII
jgi:hypothetical protein